MFLKGGRGKGGLLIPRPCMVAHFLVGERYSLIGAYTLSDHAPCKELCGLAYRITRAASVKP